MSIRTLIVLGSSLTALAVVRTAHRKGMRCVMLDDVPGPATATRLARFRRLETYTASSIAAAAGDLAGRNDVAIVADSDRWLRFVRANRDFMTGNGWLVLHPDADAIDICLDKTVFLKWCAANGFGAPRVYDPAALQTSDPMAYPLMMRPEWTQHSNATGLPKALEIRDRSELLYWLERYGAVQVHPNIAESLLREGLRQFSVGAARDASGRVQTFLAEKVRPHAEQCAGGTLVRPAQQPGIEDLAARALHALSFFGVAEVEVLFDTKANRAYLIEVNARPWLQYGLPFACGCDLLGHVLGEPAKAAAPDRSHAWLYFSSDVYACFSRSTGLVFTGKIGVGEYLKSIAGADTYAVWDRRDPVPLLRGMLGTLRSFLTRIRGVSRHQATSASRPGDPVSPPASPRPRDAKQP